MIVMQIGDRFVRTREFRRDWEWPVVEDKEDREMRVASRKHEVDEHYKKRGIAV